MDLLARRAEVAARAKILCSVSGSGWHKNDPAEAERRAAGHVPLTEKVIGLKDDDRVYLVGPCVATVVRGLGAYAEGVLAAKATRREEIAAAEAQLAADPESRVRVPEELEYAAVERHAFAVARRWARFAGPELCLPVQDWNGALLALAQVGVQAVISDANCTPEEERA